MIPIVGRLPFSLGRLFGSPQPVPPNNLDNSVYPVIDIEGQLPERAFLRAERRYQASVDVTGIAASSPAVTLTLGTSNNILVIIEYLRVELVAVPGAVTIHVGPNVVQAGTTELQVAPRDLRLGSAAPLAKIQSSTNYGAPADPRFIIMQMVAGETQVFKDDGWILSSTSGAGGGLVIFGAVATQRIQVAIGWRERPLASGEASI